MQVAPVGALTYIRLALQNYLNETIFINCIMTLYYGRPRNMSKSCYDLGWVSQCPM